MPKNKISETNFKQLSKKLKNSNKKIVFTNGCFDILHPGHIHLFEKAKSFGDILIVGVNSDSSIKKIKGSNRPLTKWKDRVQVLAALESIDYVVKMSDTTPINLIKLFKPDIHVKGGDYVKEKLPEFSTVEKIGGKIKIVKFLGSFSTTNIVKKISSQL